MDRGIRGSLRRESNGRPTGGRNGIRKGALVAGGAVLLALGVAGQFAGPWSDGAIDRGAHERARPSGPVTIDADQLHKAYQDDPGAAAERFEGREMVVSGEFLRIVPDGYGSLDLRLKTFDPEEPLGIDVAQLSIEEAKQLRPGQRVTVSCQQMGSGGDEIWVQDCAIQLEGDPALPPSAAPPSGEEQE